MAKKKPEAVDTLENFLNPVSTPFPSTPQKEHIGTAEETEYTSQAKTKKKKIKGFVITDENIHRLEEMRAILVKKFYKVDYSLIINLAIEHYYNYLKQEDQT
jgi:translation initiation factor IF-2